MRLEDEYLTTSEAAAYLGYSQEYVTRLAKAGRLPATKLGRQWVIPRDKVRQWRPEPVGYPLGRPRG